MSIGELYDSVAPALIQALTVRPTRVALACTSPARLTPYRDVELALDALDSTALDVDHSAALAPGSLGFGCKTFWLENGLKPLVMGAPAQDSAACKLLQRRLALHDSLHVLLDFEADPPGQLGVFSFVAAQRYCPQFDWSARRLAQLYMIAAPWARDALAEAEYRGRQLGLRAPRLLTMPLELEWNTSLVVLRDRLNIRKARTLRSIAAASHGLPNTTPRAPAFAHIAASEAARVQQEMHPS